MSFRSLLRSLLVGLLGIAATASHAQQPTVITTGNWPVSVITGYGPNGWPALAYCDPGINGASTGCRLLSSSSTPTLDFFVPAVSGVYTIAFNNLGHGTLASVVTLANYSDPRTSLDFTIFDGQGGYRSNSFPTQGSKPAVAGAVQAYHPAGSTGLAYLAEETANGYLYSLDGDARILWSAQLANGQGPYIMADINGDGNTDIIVLAADPNTSNVATFLGNGDGTFTPGADIAPYAVFSMLLADIDGDHIPDLVVETSDSTLSYYPGTATGFATTAIAIPGAQDGSIGQGGHLVAVADLNGDHIPDIITSTPAGISVLIGQSATTPSYKLLNIYNAGPGRGSYALADFNSDGHLDLAVDSPEGIAILYGNADGSFQTSHAYASAKPADAIALGNFTGSGNVDVLVANEAPRILAGDGQGAFTLTPDVIPITSSTQGLFAVAAGDFDGDGKLDAVFIPQGSFSPPPLPPPPPPPPGTICACFTFVTAGPNAYIDKGTGIGQFSSLAVLGYTGTTSSALPLDANGDGIADLANFNYAGCVVESALASPGGTLETQLFSDTDAISLFPGPFNDSYVGAVGYLKSGRVGKQDIVCQNLTAIRVFRNNGDGTYIQTASFPNPSNYAVIGSDDILPTTGILTSTILLQDLDGDGNGDLIVVYPNLDTTASPSGSAVYIYWGNGDGTFTSPLILSPQRNNYLAAVADVDGDSQSDIILSDGNLLTVLRGQGTARTFATEQHYLAGMGINAIASTSINGHTAVIVANGGTAISNPIANRGILKFNTGLSTGGITVLAIPHDQTTEGSLTATPSNPGYGEPFTLTATINTVAGVAPTGAVNFSVDGTSVGTGIPLTNGTATSAVTAPAFSVGTHTVTATYSGDSNYPATTLTTSLDVALLPTVTSITNVLTPIFYGQTIADDAIGSTAPTDPSSAAATLLGGDLTFFIDDFNVCVLPVNGNTERCPAATGANYSAGPHTIYSIYSGNAFYATSMSPKYPVQILPDVVSQGTLTTSGTPATASTPVTFTAVFTAPFATPNGPVTFLDGSTIIGTGTLDATGTARFTTSALALGNHTIVATYAGNIDFDAASSNSLPQAIVPTPLATVTMLGSSSNPSTVGQSVTFTAAVAPTSASAVTPSGTVTFTIDGSAASSNVPLTRGSASFTISTLALGNHNVIATYTAAAGNSTPFSSSTSNILVQVVNAAPPAPTFTLTINPGAIAVPIGNTATALITLTPVGGFNQPVTLSCGSLPREATCTFAADTFASGNGSTFMNISATAPHTCGTTQPYFISSGPTTWLGLLGTCGLMLLLRRRRRLVKGIVLTLALCILPALTGCGNCTDLGVEPGSYSFTVTATSTGASPVTKTQTVQMVAHL